MTRLTKTAREAIRKRCEGIDEFTAIYNDRGQLAFMLTDVPKFLAEIDRLEEELRKIQKRAARDLYSEACVEIERISRGELEGMQ